MFTEHLVKLPDDAMEWLLALVLGNNLISDCMHYVLIFTSHQIISILLTKALCSQCTHKNKTAK